MPIIDGCNATSFVPLLPHLKNILYYATFYRSRWIFFQGKIMNKSSLHFIEFKCIFVETCWGMPTISAWERVHKRINVWGSKALWVNVVFTGRKLTPDSNNLLHMLVTEPWRIEIMPALFCPQCGHSALIKEPSPHI